MGRVAQIVTLGAQELGFTLPPAAPEQFELYYQALTERGKIINLTAVTGEENTASLHFLDSIALLKAADFAGAKVIDIGSGAGLPGVPLKIVQPSLELTLLDSTGKRVDFLRGLCAGLGLEASFLHARAEESSHEPEFREQYDIAVSRAVARMNVLCELCLPFVRPGGKFVAMKSLDGVADELAEAVSALEKLGAQLHEQYNYTIPGTDITHCVAVIRKLSPTPDEYPRRFARIKKQPL